MKTLLIAFGTAFLLGFPVAAQEDAPPPLSAAMPAVSTSVRFDNLQLDQLLGPIALYPDALVALILPAATVPSDVVLAARYLRDGGEAAQIDAQNWDDSVRALARYPDVVKWMDENLAWTKQLGEAFVAQPSDVMNAVQRLRLKARSVGSLVDTPQQQVVVDNSTITIVPAQPDVIYVPYYDPEVVYVSRPTYYTRPFFSFSPAYASGFWLSYNVDWHQRRVWCVDRPHRETHWREHQHHWHRPSYSGRVDFTHRGDHYRTWSPRPAFHRPSQVTRSYDRPVVVRPRHHDGSSNNRYEGRSQGSSERRWDQNYARPAHATGERFPTAPRGLSVPRASSTSHAPRLADPLPHAIPSPLPEVQPATQTPDAHQRFPGQRDRGSRTHEDRGFGDRSRGDHNRSDHTRSENRSTGHRQVERSHQSTGHPPAVAVAPSISPRTSTHATQPGRIGFQPRHTSAPSIAATPAAPAPAATAPATNAYHAPASDQPAARSSESRSQEYSRGSHGRGVGRRSNER